MVEREHAGACPERDHRRCPDVVHRQEQVEVQHFAAVLAFDEADLDSLGRGSRVHYRKQRVVRGRGAAYALRRVVRIDQDLTQPVSIHVHRLHGAREAQRADARYGGIKGLLLERVHGCLRLLCLRLSDHLRQRANAITAFPSCTYVSAISIAPENPCAQFATFVGPASPARRTRLDHRL